MIYTCVCARGWRLIGHLLPGNMLKLSSLPFTRYRAVMAITLHKEKKTQTPINVRVRLLWFLSTSERKWHHGSPGGHGGEQGNDAAPEHLVFHTASPPLLLGDLGLRGVRVLRYRNAAVLAVGAESHIQPPKTQVLIFIRFIYHKNFQLNQKKSETQ